MAVVAGLALAVAAVPARADGGEAPSGPAFGTELAAVVAATSAVNARSVREDREFLGAVLRRGPDYHYSVVAGQPGADRIRARLVVPAGFEVMAFWHTHGAAAPERRFFSGVDVALVEGSGKPLYLADGTGALRVLRPGAPRLSGPAARRLGLPGRPGFAAGEELRGPEGDPVHIPTRDDAVLAAAVRN
jgi:hypothetical protein